MIEEQFVSFDTSKLLKEVGFDVPTRGICRTDREGNHEFIEYDRKQTPDDLSWNCGDGFQYEYLCPTQALAARWLREVHKLHVWCETTPYGDWFCCISKIKPYEEYAVVSEAEYSSFEQAFETGLREAIKLIKK